MNATVKKAQEDLEGLRIRTRKILDEHKTQIPAEEQKALAAIKERADELRAVIDNETKLADAKRDLEDLDRYLDSPQRKIPHGVDPNADGVKSLLGAGWEIKAGVVYAPSSLEGTKYRDQWGEWKTVGKVPMYTAEVLFGDVPTDDPDSARYYRTTRAAFNPTYRAAYDQYLKNCVKMRNESMALSMLSGAEQKALSEGTDTAGGFVVPPDIQAEMFVRLAQEAVIRGNARVQPTNRDVLRYPAVAANTGTYSGISGGSILSSGFVGGWVGETPAFSDTDPAFQNFDVPVKKLRVATRLSNDFVSDAAVNVMAFMAQNGAENMALVEDLGFIQGLGAALQPLGILNGGSTTTSVEGSTSHTISNTSSATGSYPKIQTLFYSLPPQYARKSKWLMRRTIEGKIRGLVDGQNRPIWMPWSTAGMAGDAPSDLLGRPILHSDWMPDDGTANNNVLVIGDWSYYIIAQRTQITSVVLRERFADVDQIGIILFERVGGAVWNNDAFRLGYV